MALVAVAGVGCGGEDDAETIQSSLTAENALTVNALTVNALTVNALTVNALTVNSLTVNSLVLNALRDPLARELLKYVVSCALEDGDRVSVRVDGRRYNFEGSIGLAPEWGTERGWCDGECQRWVSACVLARVDAAGVKRMISIRGDNPALRPEHNELRKYSEREATYYGNLFVPGQPRFFCLPPGRTSNERVCGDSLADCPMKIVGSCSDACAGEGPYRSFVDCSDRIRPRHGSIYHESVTVFLPK